MFARKACYFFVRPKRDHLELCVFLGREVRSPLIKKAMASSKTKTAHLIRLLHRDQVEPPITDWLREAYGFQDMAATAAEPARRAAAKRPRTRTQPKAKRQTRRVRD
jgi:hypothetical protein